MQFVRRIVVLAAAIVLGGAAAQAATLPTVAVDPFNHGDFDAAVAGLHSAVVEDFESFTPGEVFGGLSTSVGVFDTLGQTGSGSTVKGTDGNTGTGVYIRNRGVSGRSNTTARGKSYLDSNDTFGISWTITGLGMFDRVFFTMSDVADNGGNFGFQADGTPFGPTISKRRNGSIDMVMLSFTTAVDTLTLELRNRRNDGFSIDDAAVGFSVAAQQPPAVPLPPAAALLTGGVAALVLIRRRRA